MSPHQRTFGAGAVKSRLSRSGNFGAFLSCLVNPLRRLGLRPNRPCLAIESATVFSPTDQPASSRSRWMRGEPYVRSEASNSSRTLASSSRRRCSCGVTGALIHL